MGGEMDWHEVQRCNQTNTVIFFFVLLLFVALIVVVALDCRRNANRRWLVQYQDETGWHEVQWMGHMPTHSRGVLSIDVDGVEIRATHWMAKRQGAVPVGEVESPRIHGIVHHIEPPSEDASNG